MISKSAIPGAYDLKRLYQKNMAIGFGVSGAMHFTVLAALILLVFQSKDIVVLPPVESVRDSTIYIIPPVRSPREYTNHVKTSEDKKVDVRGIPTPVPDKLAPTDTDVPDQQQLSILAPDTPIENLGPGIEANIENIVNALIPPPDSLIFYDEPPAVVTSIMPIYPDLAQRTGLEGYVLIKAYVDKDGQVKEAFAAAASPPNVGFEEAAIYAAKQTAWRPAIANGLPIGVWITYKVKFGLRDS